MGIGLSLVKQFVEMHGGDVTAASEGADQGSRFGLRLPALSPNAAREWVVHTHAAACVPLRALRALAVDDQRDAADALSQLLCLQGHDAEAAYEVSTRTSALVASVPI